jgi:hypothetical protein
MLYVASLLAAEHQNDLLREAEAERRAALVRGARRSAWSLFLGRVAGLLRRFAGSVRRGSAPARPADPRPATT